MHRAGFRQAPDGGPTARASSGGRRGTLILPVILLICLACTGAATAATLILPLGDSITHGSDSYPSYRTWLYQDLRALGYDVDFVGSSHTPALVAGLDPDNEGHPGFTAGMVQAGLPDWLGVYSPPDVVLVHLGTNDAINSVPRDRTIADFRSIIGMLRARNPNMTILLARIIPTSVALTNTRIEALNREIAGLQSLSTAQSPILIVDQYSGYNGQADNQAGGVHPLTSGEKKMAARWEGALLPVLDRVAPPEPGPFGPHAIPGRIEAEDYDVGGYSDTTPGNAGGVYRHDDVDIEYAAAEGSYVVGWIRDRESLTYTADVTAGGPFWLTARVASPYDGREAVLTVNGTGTTVIRVPNTGSFDAYATVTLEVVLPAGEQCLTLRFSGDGQNLNWLEFAAGAPGPTVTVPPLPPQDVTDLRNTTYEPTSITWTWTDPADSGFANLTVCHDGVPVETLERGVQEFTATGLAPATAHTIATRTRNTAGAASATWANHTAWTAPLLTPVPTPAVTETSEPTVTETPEPTVTETPEPTVTETPEPTVTETPEPTVTKTPEPTVTETPEPTVAETPEPTVTETPEPTVAETPEPTVTETPEPTVTETPEPTVTETPEPTVTETPEPTATETPEPTATETPEPTATEAPTPTVTETPESTATEAPTPAVTETSMVTETPTLTPTPAYVLMPVSPAGEPPLDLDGDGVCEDVNGNGRADFADVVLFFGRLDWCVANEPISAFDFNGNGRIDFADVVALFGAL